jgi:hypothetical protein
MVGIGARASSVNINDEPFDGGIIRGQIQFSGQHLIVE